MTALDPIPTARVARGPGRWRLALVTGAALVLIGGAAIATAASPEPSASPDTSTTPDTNEWRGPGGFGRHGRGAGLFDGFAGFAGPHGGFGAGNISITAINGSSLSLETVDGWTRTITVGSDTAITKAGETIALSDVSVGDRIRFRQTVDDDGNYTVSAIDVVIPHAVGQVTAKGSDSLMLEQPDGSRITVHVDGSTSFTVGGETGKALADITVGMIAGAAGELNDDGSMNASAVRAGSIWERAGRGRGPGRWLDPEAAPSATPDNSSTSAG